MCLSRRTHSPPGLTTGRKRERDANAVKRQKRASSETPPMLLSRKQTVYYKKEVFKAGLLACLAIGAFPSYKTVACRPIVEKETYSSGYCSGFTPDSLLSSRQGRLRQKQVTKIAGFDDLKKIILWAPPWGPLSPIPAHPVHNPARTMLITTSAVTAWLMYLT